MDIFDQLTLATSPVCSRTRSKIVITTNRPFRERGKILDVDNTLATALIDRLMHHGEEIVIQGDSYRMKDKEPDSTDECYGLLPVLRSTL